MTWALSLLIFSGVTTFWGLLASLVAGKLTVFVAWSSIIAGLISVVAFLWLNRKSSLKLKELSFFDVLMCLAFGLFVWRHFLWIFYYKDGALFTSGANNIGDLPLHLTYISRFTHGAPFWPTNPIFAAESLHYPVGMDLF